MLRYLLLTILFCIIIQGCVSPQAKLSAYKDHWAGRPFDDFVRTNGIPTSEFKLNDGSKIFTMAAGQTSVRIPATTTITSYSSNKAYATTTGGGVIHVGCVLRITVDPNGLITQITILSDSIGRWVTSRCYEVLPDVSTSIGDSSP